MAFLLHIVALLACLQTVCLYPLQDSGNFQLYDSYGMGLAKRPYYTYNDDILSPFNYLGASPSRSQAHRKKAVDSTFIRFGRSAPSDSTNRAERSLDSRLVSPNLLQDSAPLEASPDSPDLPQLYLLNHNGCKLRSGQELMKALLSDPNCIRAFQKAKKENVNDTFIRFGKREAPPEKQFENENSKEA